MDWVWWTYFDVDGELVSRGRIIDYALPSRTLRYAIWREPSWVEREAPYKRIWVDTKQRVALALGVEARLLAGEGADGFIALGDGQDPKEFFAGARVGVASWGPRGAADEPERGD